MATPEAFVWNDPETKQRTISAIYTERFAKEVETVDVGTPDVVTDSSDSQVTPEDLNDRKRYVDEVYKMSLDRDGRSTIANG